MNYKKKKKVKYPFKNNKKNDDKFKNLGKSYNPNTFISDIRKQSKYEKKKNKKNKRIFVEENLEEKNRKFEEEKKRKIEEEEKKRKIEEEKKIKYEEEKKRKLEKRNKGIELKNWEEEKKLNIKEKGRKGKGNQCAFGNDFPSLGDEIKKDNDISIFDKMKNKKGKKASLYEKFNYKKNNVEEENAFVKKKKGKKKKNLIYF